MWQCEPDHSQHSTVLGSPQHLEAIAAADANAQTVAEAVITMNANGEDILLLIGSDHGHETVGEVVDLESKLVEAGLKADLNSKDVVVTSQGLSAFVYLASDQLEKLKVLLYPLSHDQPPHKYS